MRDVVNLLLLSWDTTSVLDAAAGDDRDSSQGHFSARAKLRARRALERVYKSATPDTLNAIIVYWRQASEDEVSSILSHTVSVSTQVLTQQRSSFRHRESSRSYKLSHRPLAR